MPPLRLRLPATIAQFEAGFAAIRQEFGVPAHHSPRVQRVAARSARTASFADRDDLRELGFLAIDPEGSRDLDQAFFAVARGEGHRLWYAIADVAGFIAPGDPVDVEARERGVTLYAPDRDAPLHPAVLSAGAASLLPGRPRPAIVWRIDLDAEAEPTEVRVTRAIVRCREALSYAEAQRRIDLPATEPVLVALREIGERREARERERGAVSINLPGQEVRRRDGAYELAYDVSRPVEGWNAQISLLTGIVAARLMRDAGIGVLRTLPPADPEVLASLRRSARALGFDWPDATGYAAFVRGLDPASAEGVTMLTQSVRALRGAGYEAFDGAPPPRSGHAGVAAPYAHVTAPLRRLVDRFGLEIALAVSAGREPPAWVREALPDLPDLMAAARRREGAYERAIVDLVETIILGSRVGESFPAVVVDRDGGRATVMLRSPAIVARLNGAEGAEPGDRIRVRVAGADPVTRRLELEPA